jgi:hypothetical protein
MDIFPATKTGWMEITGIPWPETLIIANWKKGPIEIALK